MTLREYDKLVQKSNLFGCFPPPIFDKLQHVRLHYYYVWRRDTLIVLICVIHFLFVSTNY